MFVIEVNTFLNFILEFRANRNAKHALEHDWSHKFEAWRADNRALSRKNTDVDIMYYAGSARYQET
jgi:hypothetical protein